MKHHNKTLFYLKVPCNLLMKKFYTKLHDDDDDDVVMVVLFLTFKIKTAKCSEG